MKALTDTDFETTIGATSGVSVVKFHAAWCQPCKALAPVMEQIATDYADQANFYSVDCEEAQDVSVAMKVRSLPTLALFKDGKPVATKSGAMNKQQIVEWISQATA